MKKSTKNSQGFSERKNLEAMIPPERRKELAMMGLRKGAMMAAGMAKFRKAQNPTG